MAAVALASALHPVPDSTGCAPTAASFQLTVVLSPARMAQLATSVLALLQERIDARIATVHVEPDCKRWSSVVEIAPAGRREP